MRIGATFTVDAKSVQGNDGATVTFRALKVGTMKGIRAGEVRDTDLLESHVVAWAGFVDDDSKALPSPKDEPGALDALYVHEQAELVRLLLGGPHGDSVKN